MSLAPEFQVSCDADHHEMLLENTAAWDPSWESLVFCKLELGPGYLHFYSFSKRSHHLPGLVITEAPRGEGSQTGAEAQGGHLNQVHVALRLLASSSASHWTNSFLQFSFPLDASIWARAEAAGPVLPSPPHPQPQRSGTSQPPAGMSIYGSVVPKCGQIYKLPLPGDTKQFAQSPAWGQSWELCPGPGLQPGPKPNELWRWTGPSPSLGLSFSTYRAKELD